MLAETVILRSVPGDREPAAALRNVTADIGLASDEIHAYFITTVYDCRARITISWIFHEVVFPSADDKISARAVVYAPEIRQCWAIKRSANYMCCISQSK